MIALPLFGVALLSVLLVDILLTVFPPLGHGGPLHRRQNRVLWRMIRSLTQGLSEPVRARAMALVGPMMTVAAVAVWAGWLIVGFALIYAGIPGAFLDMDPAAIPAWSDALYYSGYVATTLGLGDVIAATVTVRAVTVVEAMTGFALFAVATTYVLAISRELTGSNTLALELATAHDTASAGSDSPSASWIPEAWSAEWSRHLLRVALAHGQYPLIQFFRPLEVDRDLAVQIGWLVRASEARREPTGESSGTLRDPTDELLFASLARYLVEVNDSCIPRGFEPLDRPLDRAALSQLHERLLSYLGQGARMTSG